MKKKPKKFVKYLYMFQVGSQKICKDVWIFFLLCFVNNQSLLRMIATLALKKIKF
jgi:hypothetical protein